MSKVSAVETNTNTGSPILNGLTERLQEKATEIVQAESSNLPAEDRQPVSTVATNSIDSIIQVANRYAKFLSLVKGNRETLADTLNDAVKQAGSIGLHNLKVTPVIIKNGQSVTIGKKVKSVLTDEFGRTFVNAVYGMNNASLPALLRILWEHPLVTKETSLNCTALVERLNDWIAEKDTQFGGRDNWKHTQGYKSAIAARKTLQVTRDYVGGLDKPKTDSGTDENAVQVTDFVTIIKGVKKRIAELGTEKDLDKYFSSFSDDDTQSDTETVYELPSFLAEE